MVLFDYIYADMFGELGYRLVVGEVSSWVHCITLIKFLGFVNELIED